MVTLAVGVAITVLLSFLLGILVGFPVYGSEVLSRTTPNLLDLAIALVAGVIATYGKVHSEAVASVAGTAIAVALAAITPGMRTRLWSSRLGLVSLLLTALLLIPLSGSFLNLVARARHDSALQQVERAIAESLRQRTLTLGKDSQLMSASIDWSRNPPLITASVRVSRPNLPTPQQVAAVQNFINRSQPINFRLRVQRMSIDLIGPETAPNPPEAQLQLLQPPSPPLEGAEAMASGQPPRPPES